MAWKEVTRVDKDKDKQLEKFLDATENYLKDLGDKVKVAKIKAAVDEGDLGMAEVITRENEEGEGQGTAGTKLYDAAHSMDHDIQLPHLLSPPGLTSYQVTGLKWMTCLYNYVLVVLYVVQRFVHGLLARPHPPHTRFHSSISLSVPLYGHIKHHSL